MIDRDAIAEIICIRLYEESCMTCKHNTTPNGHIDTTECFTCRNSHWGLSLITGAEIADKILDKIAEEKDMLRQCNENCQYYKEMNSSGGACDNPSNKGLLVKKNYNCYVSLSAEPYVESYVSNKPHLCPVCRGNGMVPPGFYINYTGSYTSGTATAEQCRSCGGTGIVWGR